MQIPHFVISQFQEQCLPSLWSHRSRCRGVSRIRGAGAHPEQAQSCPGAVCVSASCRAALAAPAIRENLENGALSCALLLLRSPSRPRCRQRGPTAPRGPAEKRHARAPPAGALPTLLLGSPSGCPSYALGWGCTGEQGWAEEPSHTCLTWSCSLSLSLSPAGAGVPGSPAPLAPAVP